tara:strand:- start:2299 stop:2859 length:561 start_codon:yes stop_codon:yes gene_type:complete
MKRGFNLTNRVIYTLITFTIFILAGVAVFAYNSGFNDPSIMGHSADEIEGILSGGSVPTGAVMAFSLTNCPTGWSESIDARGRYIVGMPLGGTIGSTVGTALSEQENRAVGQHTHTGSSDTTGSHTHTYSIKSGGGTTAPSGAGGSYTSTATGSSGSHSHTITMDNAGSVAGTNAPYIQFLICVKD